MRHSRHAIALALIAEICGMAATSPTPPMEPKPGRDSARDAERIAEAKGKRAKKAAKRARIAARQAAQTEANERK